jgi:DNA transformation protein
VLQPFEYVTNGKPMKMSYCMAPEEVYEDESATLALEAAMRVSKKSLGRR